MRGKNSPRQPLVSVATPVYNGEKYLAECIESVLAQTYENWEYLIVNNCSTDRTLNIAQHYAKEDGRIRIFTNTEFVGAIRNHNIAVGKISADSKYCKLLQGDDWIFPECLTQMVRVAEANPTVGVVGCYMLNGDWVDCDGLPYSSPVLSGGEICRMTLLGSTLRGRPMIFGNMSSVLIRSDLIRKRTRFYNEAHSYADKEACFEVLQESDFGFVHQVLTYNRRHPEQLSALEGKFNIWPLVQLDFLTRYGPGCLGGEEYERCLRDSMDLYYRMLAGSIFKLREKEFWDYHRTALRDIGHRFSLARLIKGAVAGVVDPFLEPVRALHRQMEFVRGKSKK